MKYFRTLVLVFTLLYVSNLNAQFTWTPAKVILKNGESFRGLVKFPKNFNSLITIGSSKFKYRKNKKSKVQKLGSDTVEEVVFGDEDFRTVHFKYVSVSKNRSILMEEIISGKVSLFARTTLTTETIVDYTLEDYETTIYYDKIDYYLIKETETKATKVPAVTTKYMFKSFIKKYFEDCNKLVGYIEDELYSRNELLELVEDYNLLCDE